MRSMVCRSPNKGWWMAPPADTGMPATTPSPEQQAVIEHRRQRWFHKKPWRIRAVGGVDVSREVLS